MKKSNSNINQCTLCGEFRGFLVSEEEPSHITRGFCRCEPEGWEICSRHKDHVRRRFRTIKIDNSAGEFRYFSVYSMMAPCRDETCFKPSRGFFKEVQKNHKLVYSKE